jgi:PTS system nitrogen regulatory IIA component
MNLTVEDLTRLFKVSEKTIYRWIKRHGLPAYRVHHQFRFNRTDLLEWAAARRVNVSAGTLDPAGRGSSALPEPPSPTSLAEALEAGGIYYRVGGTDKAAVLAEIVRLLRLPERIDRALLLEILRAREELGSTAIGDGIAIPHPRNPIMFNVEQPTITLCFLEHPIDFEALDSRPVGVVFTLISPTVPMHLNLLSRLMYVLRQATFKDLLVREGSRAEIMEAVHHAEAAIAEHVVAR